MENQFSKRFLNIKNKIEDENYFNNLSLKELNELLQEAKEAEKEYNNLELIVKRDANSLYGTTGSEFYSLGDYDSAEDITQTGKHYAVIVDIAINKFFVNWDINEWNIIKEFYPEANCRKFTEYKPDTIEDLCVYGDTDSRYINLSKIYNLINIKIPNNTLEGNEELSKFGTFIMDKFINKIIKDTIDNDINYRNANPGRLKMAHEITTRRSILQKKKKYVMNAVWKDGKFLNKNKIIYKGVEIKKGEINKNMKKIIQILLEKFIEEKSDESSIRLELLKLIKHIKKQNNKAYIYKISSVSGLKEIYKENNIWKSDKNHIQRQMAVFWYNFITKNNLLNEYKFPFEGQKMYYYYSTDPVNGQFVVAIPDDVDINSVKNLPEPDWNLMLNEILLKPILRYIKNYEKIDNKIIENFLLDIKEIII